MPGLGNLVRGYLAAGGYRTYRDEGGCVHVARKDPAGKENHLFAWIDEAHYKPSNKLTASEQRERSSREEMLKKAFQQRMAEIPGAKGFYLISSRQGLSQSFVKVAPQLLGGDGYGVRVPVEFFDTPYKAESGESNAAHSVTSDFLKQIAQQRRVPQPFSIRRSLDRSRSGDGGPDLVERLKAEMQVPIERPKLRLIDGSAGGGKTYAFNALFDGLHSFFINLKMKKGIVQDEDSEDRVVRGASRPIVFLPEHLRSTSGLEIRKVGHVNELIDAVMHSDVAQVVPSDQFRWLLHKGFSVWMFDGLDEIYGGDNDFFPFIESMLAAPDSKAQFLICSRDSLLSSSRNMRDFVDRHLEKGVDIEIYELLPWDVSAWRKMAWYEIEGGKPGTESSDRVKQFVNALARAPEIANLAALPFYCQRLAIRFKEGNPLTGNEIEILDNIFADMVQREKSKNLYDWTDFIAEDIHREFTGITDALMASGDFNLTMKIRENANVTSERLGMYGLSGILEGVAHAARRLPNRSTPTASLSTDVLRYIFGEDYKPADMTPQQQERLVLVLIQFAFFGEARERGSIEFTHPIFADYLAARYAARCLKRELVPYYLRKSRWFWRSRSRLDERTIRVVEATVSQALGTAPFEKGSIFQRVLSRDIHGRGNGAQSDADADADELRVLLHDTLASGQVQRADIQTALRLLIGHP